MEAPGRDTVLRAIVETALQQNTLSGIGLLLKRIAEEFGAFGCTLWEVAPPSDLDASPPQGHLFVLAQWFPADHGIVLYNLPLDSATGDAVKANHSVNIADITQSDRVYKQRPFLAQNRIVSLCSLPLTFRDGKRGSLNLYRQAGGAFTLEEVDEAEAVASLVPYLYQAILDRVGFDLQGRVIDLLREAQIQAQEHGLSLVEARDPLDRLCRAVADGFQCLEATVVLEDPLLYPGIYRVVASTWPGVLRKTKYEADKSHGLTGWVLAEGRPVRLFDLAHVENYRRAIQVEYPGLKWSSRSLPERVLKYLHLSEKSEPPPLSFIAVPILIGNRTLGAIRCSAPRNPFYLGEHELELLRIVASQIGQFWNDLVTRQEMSLEIRSWQSLVESVGRLNTFVHGELSRPVPDEQNIFDKALSVIKASILGADIMDVRLYDPETKVLYFSSIAGSAWKSGDPEEDGRRFKKRFPVGAGKLLSAGAFVFQTGQHRVIEDVRVDQYYSGTFPETRRMIIVPIEVSSERFGVLDVRGTGASPFPRHAPELTALLGNQLGLYHYLATTVGRLKRAESDLKATIAELGNRSRQEQQTYEDLAHQLKSPIFLAHARVQELLHGDLLSEKVIKSGLLAIRGLCGKAKRATNSTRLFAELARDRPVSVNLSFLSYPDLLKLLTEAAADHELLVEPDQRLRFQVERESFTVLRSLEVFADRDHLEQAISNLLDNAGKYSFPNTVVRIYGGKTGTSRFHITVSNRGLPIRSSEVSRSIVRGWRSEEAQLVTGEGSGIGLWIVHHIMLAHGGSLVVSPTVDSENEIKIVFPVH